MYVFTVGDIVGIVSVPLPYYPPKWEHAEGEIVDILYTSHGVQYKVLSRNEYIILEYDNIIPLVEK